MPPSEFNLGQPVSNCSLWVTQGIDRSFAIFFVTIHLLSMHPLDFAFSHIVYHIEVVIAAFNG